MPHPSSTPCRLDLGAAFITALFFCDSRFFISFCPPGRFSGGKSGCAHFKASCAGDLPHLMYSAGVSSRRMGARHLANHRKRRRGGAFFTTPPMRFPLLHFSRRVERCVWVGRCVRSLRPTPLLALLRVCPRGLSSEALAAYPIDGPQQAMFWSFLGRVYGLPYRPSALCGGSISVCFLVVVSIPRLGANFRRCLYLAYYLIRFCVYSVEFGSFARGDSPPYAVDGSA